MRLDPRIWRDLPAAVAMLVMATACFHESEEDAKPARPWFNHVTHIETGAGCEDCHAPLEEGDGVGFPALEFCMDCHAEIDEEKPPERRAKDLFFPDGEEGQPRFKHVSRLADEIIFSHNAHTGYVAECSTCHVGVDTSTAVGQELAVTMEACMGCHERVQDDRAGLTEDAAADPIRAQELARNDCATCHREIRKDRKPPSHRGLFLRNHGKMESLKGFEALPGECAICHDDRSSCDACHLDMPPLNHTNHWRFRGHALMSAIDRESCKVCHRTGDFCLRCHEEMRPLDHRGGFSAPLNRHCYSCHLPLGTSRCRTCHQETPGHDFSPSIPGNAVHNNTNNPSECLNCHTPMRHAFNGDSCFFCHRR